MTRDEIEALRSALRRWAETQVAPFAASVDAEGRFPSEAFSAFVRDGWVGLQYPESLGGSGGEGVASAVLIEELARVCGSSSLMALISKLAMNPVIDFGTDAQKNRFVRSIAQGARQASFCLSEAEAGSDVAALRTTARRVNGEYVLSGTKCWITNAGVSDLYVVFAKTDPDASKNGISCFVVDAGPDVELTRLEQKLGMRGSPTGEIVLHEVRVPAANRVGEEGQGFTIAMAALTKSRPMIGAQAVGIAAGAIDLATNYVRDRHQFGSSIASFEGVQFMLADMAMQTEAARQLVYEAVDRLVKGPLSEQTTAFSAMAKCFASDVAMSVATDAVQLFGGNGYTSAYPIERYFRDAKITQIYEGTNQIQRLVIARHIVH